ncbi:hypothetical protein [Nannocystis pusilla]|uniref:hypothetical protein n=1 Tax=Nannocystis pusilla TaxID=889268 RepID=UPI003B80041D
MSLLLGVVPSSVYRWEAKAGKPIRLDPGNLRLLTALTGFISHKPPEVVAEWGASITAALVTRGGLFALFKALEAVFGALGDETFCA